MAAAYKALREYMQSLGMKNILIGCFYFLFNTMQPYVCLSLSVSLSFFLSVIALLSILLVLVCTGWFNFDEAELLRNDTFSCAQEVVFCVCFSKIQLL